MKGNLLRLKKLLVLFLFLSFFRSGFIAYGQTVLINPTSDGGFENGTTFAANGWTVVNDGTNDWIVGTGTNYTGSRGAYVSSNGTTNQYNKNNNQTSHFYRDVTIPSGQNDIELSFYVKGVGEADFDRLLIYTAPTSVTPVAGVPVQWTTTFTGATLVYTQSNTISNYSLQTITLPTSLGGTTFRLIFTWQNDDNTGSDPPAAIDNIQLTSQTGISYTSSGTYAFTVTSDMSNLTIEAWGGGGGGYNGNNNGGGKGGGGGGYAKHVIATPTPGNYTVIVGAGGGEGSNGTASSFGANTVVADYGRGGTNQTTGGGAGGTGNIGNTITSNGGNGGDGTGFNKNDRGGGGGGAGGKDGVGLAGNDYAGAGGAGDNGSGGLGGNAGGGDGADNVLGGGGGGGGNDSGSGGSGGYPAGGGGGGENNGGSGADGKVILSWITCTPPIVYSVSGGGSYCSGGTGVNINLSGSESGVNYELYNDGVTTGAILPGDGSALTFSGVTATGTYTLVATKTSDGCASTMTGSATVTLASGVSDFTGLITNSSCPSAADGSIVIHNIADPAVEFVNADQDYIDLGSNFLSGLSEFTLEGWIKVDKSTITNRIGLFGQNDAIEFGFLDNMTIECWSPNGSLNVPLSLYPDDNDWHHIAVTGNSTNMVMYIDNVQVASGGGAASYGSSTENVRIGASVFDAVTNTTGGFTGQIKKVGFWSVALTPAQLATLASGFDFYTGSETGLLAGYNFYEGSGTSIASVTPGPTGTFANTPAWVDVVSYSWTKTGDGSFTRSTKNSSGLTSGEYNLTVSNGSCSKSNSFTVNSDNPATAIDSQSTAGQSQCEGGSFSAISVSATGTGLSYQWYSNPVASNSGGTSLGSANGAQTASYTPQVATPGTTYYYCIVSGTCETATSLVSGAFVVNALPNPTFIVSPGSGICASDDVTYTTQSNQFNYSWSVSGTENIDYSITSGGVGSANSTVTLKWLTTGSKTITVNYTDATGCTGETNATSTVTVDPLPTPGEIIPD